MCSSFTWIELLKALWEFITQIDTIRHVIHLTVKLVRESRAWLTHVNCDM